MYWQLIASVVAVVVGVFYIAKFWNNIRETVANWLRLAGWERSMLMDAWIQLDSTFSGIRCKFFLKKTESQELRVFEETYSINEIDDVDVLAELEKRGYVERNIMTYLQ